MGCFTNQMIQLILLPQYIYFSFAELNGTNAIIDNIKNSTTNHPDTSPFRPLGSNMKKKRYIENNKLNILTIVIYHIPFFFCCYQIR